jgi:hypothetical protein
MNNRSIFQQQSQDLMKIYEQATHSKKVMVVAIDYAKKEHTIMFCRLVRRIWFIRWNAAHRYCRICQSALPPG